MKYNFDKIVDRKGTISLKWENLKESFPKAKDDALSMWVADMDFECAPCILEALHNRVDRKIFGYNGESEEYIQVVSDFMKRRHDWEISRESMRFSPGVIPALGYLINILTQKGEGIIIQKPVYYPFIYLIELNERKLVNNALICKDHKYYIDFEDLEEKLKDENNKVLMFCSPHNPAGRVWTEDELKKVVALCKKYDKIIISDEIHFDLTRKGITHHVLETIDPSYRKRIITCTAPSKSFNLAGLQNSNIFINDEEIRKKWDLFTKVVAHLDGANTFGIAATMAAYRDGDEWLDECRDYIDGNIEYIKNFVREQMPKAHYIDCEGTYLVWLDLSDYGYTSEMLDTIITEEANVLLDGGSIFGKEGDGFERINVACPRAYVETCMNSIKRALENHRG